jgi:hypothetical protein
MPARALFSLFLTLAAYSSAGAQDALLRMRAQYAAETNPVDKAKILARLGSRELAAVRTLLNEGDHEEARAVLERYRDAVRDTTQALSALGLDASRRPSGFKELQISLRVFIRRLDDLIFSLQQDLRPSFRAVRSDLESAESTLIDALFPVREPRRSRSVSSQ